VTAAQYIGWAVHDLCGLDRFRSVRDEYPELLPGTRSHAASVATTRFGRWTFASLAVIGLTWYYGLGTGGLPPVLAIAAKVLLVVAGYAVMAQSVVVFGFKTADGLTHAQCMAELERMYQLVPSPGHLDVFEYYGALVLVFEQPLNPGLRDRLLGERRFTLLGRRTADLYLVELEAGTVYSTAVPWNIKKYIPALNDALGHKGEAPAPDVTEETIGQRGRATSVAFGALALIAVNAFVHLMVVVGNPQSIFLRLYRFGADNTPMVAAGEWWRLVTSIYLHMDRDHIMYNMIFLFEYARGIEPLFGAGWLLAIFVFTGICGNLLSNLFTSIGVGVGASGGIMGMGGVLVGVWLFRRDRLTLRFRSHFLVAAGLFSASIIYMGFKHGGNIGNWAHLGGFLSGLAIGSVLPFKRDGKAPWGGPWLGALAVGVSLWAAGAASLKWDWTPDVFTPVHDDALHAAFEVPEGWFTGGTKDGGWRGANGLGAETMVSNHYADVSGLLAMSHNELLNFFSTMLPDLYGDEIPDATHKISYAIADFDATKSPLGGRESLSVRFKVNVTLREVAIFDTTEEYSQAFEVVFLPHFQGYLRAAIRYPAQDADYYQPILARFKNSLTSLEEPVEYRPQAPYR